MQSFSSAKGKNVPLYPSLLSKGDSPLEVEVLLWLVEQMGQTLDN